MKSSLSGLLRGSGFRMGVCAIALQAMALGGCAGGGEAPGEPEGSEGLALTTTPVDAHGDLHIVGNQLLDEHGAPVQLRGMSLFWSQWGGAFWNASVVDELVDDWDVSLVRAAMGVEMGGYLENPNAEKQRVKTVVDAAIARGVYVIIDWHDHNATQHTQQAKAFFTEMAQLYGHEPNVIFEIYNEPDGESWGEIKAYAQEVIGAIRATGSDNVIVVGTPTWSQDVDVAAQSPITGWANIAYTLHFYAGTHKQTLRNKASYALSQGLPLFVTEWGTCDASGNGGLDLAESQVWIDFMNDNGLSWANWSLFDKPETASALVPGASTSGGWPASALTASGSFVKQALTGESDDGGGDPDPTPANFQFSVSPNINPWWIQVNVSSPGQTITSVSAKVGASTYPLQFQWWGDWATSPPSPVPAGTQVVFTAVDSQGNVGTFTSQPWPG